MTDRRQADRSADIDILDLVRRIHDGSARQDADAIMPWICDDVLFTLYVSGDLLRFAGRTQGKPAVRAQLEKMYEDFEYILYRPGPVTVGGDGESAHKSVEFFFRHRESGETLVGRLRQVWRTRAGLMAQLDEHTDAPVVEAFMRLFGGAGAGQLR